METHPDAVNDEALKEEFEEGIETPHEMEDEGNYNINALSTKMMGNADMMLGYIKMHHEDRNLSSLLNDTKMIETKLMNYLEKEEDEIKQKQTYMIFNNSNALIDSAEKQGESKFKF